MSRRVHNTLFVTNDGTRLTKERETVVVRVADKKLLQLPFRYLESITCLARTWISPELMEALTEAQVSIAFFGQGGRFLARVEGLPGRGLVLRRAQFRAAESDEKRAELAGAFVSGKLSNQRAFLVRSRREGNRNPTSTTLREAISTLDGLIRSVAESSDLDVLRGLEGAAARAYFAAWSTLVRADEPELTWNGRNRRPPTDPLNALLSFGYSILMSDCSGALMAAGLDPALGFLHAERPGRLSMALDLMEEFRTPIVDRLVLALINRGQLKQKDFHGDSATGVRLDKRGRRIFLEAYQEQKSNMIKHPFVKARVSWGEVPHIQARLFARTLRGDLETYPPFGIR